MKTLKSIEAELADCRKAWKPYAKKWRGVSAWCLHHAVHCELLGEPPKNRIDYILSEKSERERAIRFRNFRPVRVKLPPSCAKADAAWVKADATWAKAHAARVKAHAAWAKADATWAKADATWAKDHAARVKAHAARVKAHAAWAKADATWAKADATWAKADAARAKADAARVKAHAACELELQVLHAQDWPDNSWNGTSIFP